MMVENAKDDKGFHLDGSFVEKYANRKPPFGYNGAGEFTAMRTYSRIKPDGYNEQWHEIIRRVVEGTYSMQKRHVLNEKTGWNDHQGQKSAQEMYDHMFNLRFSPPGRGLWAMGSEITEEKHLYAALNNCGFVSTDGLREKLEKPFVFLMDASMLGVGVGFDTKGAGQLIVKNPRRDLAMNYAIPDTREGWVDSVGLLLRSYFLGNPLISFDYGGIRPHGAPIKTFGGKASGPEPLKELHRGLEKLLEGRVGHPLVERDIVDIQNMIGKAVIAGNVRRTAEISFGEPDCEEFLDLKNYTLNPEREGFGWASNNSIFARLGMDYSEVAKRTRENGEPGYAWLENMRMFGRMGDPPNNKDKRAAGGNPCLEQTLEDWELCTLVENYLPNIATLEDFKRVLKFSYLYAKTVTLGETHWEETNRVMKRNRRIGSSVTGVVDFVHQRGLGTMRRWLREGYNEIQKWDEVYSDWLAVPRSIKTTSVKPSGSVSLVAGVSPGIHFPHAEYYIRRINVAKNSNLVPRLETAGYPLVESPTDSESFLVEFPIKSPEGMRRKKDVSMWEQLELAAFMQEHWADNQVSATVTFDQEKEGGDIPGALDHFQYKLKGISFLPIKDHSYELPPYEEITKGEYGDRLRVLSPLDFSGLKGEESVGEKYCSNEMCELPVSSGDN